MSEATGLSDYIDKLFDDFKQMREPDEDKWQRNDDAVKGIDGTRKKGWKKGEGEGWRSNTYIKLIKAKIFTAYAMLVDVFLQGGDVPFTLVQSPHNGHIPEELQPVIDEAIEEMGDRIREQLRDRRADVETIKKFLSLAIYGMAWSKYNVLPVEHTFFEASEVDEETGMPVDFELRQTKKPVPGHEYKSVWSIFTDMEDDNLQTNRGTFDYDLASTFELRKKLGQPHYIDENIKKVISEFKDGETAAADDETNVPPGKRHPVKRKKVIPNKEFWGRVPIEDALDFEKDFGLGDQAGDVDIKERSGEEVEVLIEKAGDEIIRYLRREPKRRPFKRCYWEESLDSASGVGIADNLEDVQTVLNGMVRAFEDNKKLSANVITAIKRSFLAPGQNESLTPGKQVEITEACDDVRQALQQIIIQDVGETLLSGIDLMLSMGDKVSQIPEIMQGLTLPKHKTDTLGEINWLMENAGKYLGMVIRNNDEHFVEPEILDIYIYNMKNEEYDGQKVSCLIHATGFTSFQNKAQRQQKIMQLLQLILSDEELRAEAKVRPHLEELYKILDVDPDDYLKSSEEKRAEQQQRDEQEAEELAAQQDLIEREAEEEREDKKLELTMKAQLDDARAENEFQRDLIREGLKERRPQTALKEAA
jgi:hypothetical protein